MEKKETAKPRTEPRITPRTAQAVGLSPQKLSEDISENEQRYRDLVEHLPLGIAILLDGKLMFINISGARMMAAEKPEDMIGRNFMDFVHPDFHEVVNARLLKVYHGETAPAMEQKYVRLDGKIIDIEASSYPFVYHNKPAVQIIVKDITEQKESRLAIKKSETLFSQLFHVSPMAIVMLDNEGNVAQVNPGFEKLFGFTFEELKGNGLNQTIVPDALDPEGND